jgi:hypothetical protein
MSEANKAVTITASCQLGLSPKQDLLGFRELRLFLKTNGANKISEAISIALTSASLRKKACTA